MFIFILLTKALLWFFSLQMTVSTINSIIAMFIYFLKEQKYPHPGHVSRTVVLTNICWVLLWIIYQIEPHLI